MESLETINEILERNRKYDYSHLFKSENPSLANLIISRTLTGKGREFVIQQIKAPIEKTLLKSVRLFTKVFGDITKENTIKRNTHTLIDLEAEFFQHYYNPDKIPLMRAAWFLLRYENEHDSHYEYFIHWLNRRINEERAKGNWIDMPDAFPQPDCWKE